MVCSISSLCVYVSFEMLEVSFQQGPNLSAPRGRRAARGGRGTRPPRSRTSCRSLCGRTSSPWSPSAIGYLTSVFAGASVAARVGAVPQFNARARNILEAMSAAVGARCHPAPSIAKAVKQSAGNLPRPIASAPERPSYCVVACSEQQPCSVQRLVCFNAESPSSPGVLVGFVTPRRP